MIPGYLSCIGQTPLVSLDMVLEPCHFRLFGKIEGANPGGSTKDRAAASIIMHSLAHHLVDTNTTIVESSSGNMGIGLAMLCARLKLSFICVIDPKTTASNVAIMRAYGARIERVEEPDPATGEYLPARLARVQALLASTPNAFWPNQYANPYNALAHHQTVKEVVQTLGAAPDFLFCATSTCGTLRGCSDYLRQHHPQTRIVAVDALGSVIFGGPRARRLVPGMGAAVRPDLFRDDLADAHVHVTDRECVAGCRRLVRTEALLAGGSSGGVVAAVDRLRSSIPPGATCVAILSDRGERYLDTIYSDEWVEAHFSGLLASLEREADTCHAATY